MTRSTSSETALDIPTYYRLFFLTIEPISALLGAYFAHFQPQAYLELTHAPSAPEIHIPIGTQVVLTQLANLYLLFAINEALVLRSTSDLRVWRTLLFGLFIADFGHLFSVFKVGSDVYWKVGYWSPMDWGNVGFVYVGALTRIAFLCGFGLATETHGAVKDRVKEF
jgi:hypothetical protein